ncbi:MAG TPA: GNAT family N-acetyltransferase [Edaphocola sp.]|nr:GNAT family N-acetyltransferase [Edaphocola sp.]
MNNFTVFDKNNLPDQQTKQQIIQFLFKHLEQYGDSIPDIEKAIDYSLSDKESSGGFVQVLKVDNNISCVVVINKTGMSGYIPENILVYIATDKNDRGKGYGKASMQYAIERAEGNIALHVEPENPAKGLYEHLGFTNKYLEMRLSKPV